MKEMPVVALSTTASCWWCLTKSTQLTTWMDTWCGFGFQSPHKKVERWEFCEDRQEWHR